MRGGSAARRPVPPRGAGRAYARADRRGGAPGARTTRRGCRSMIVGTAGHIDHGKTALVKALTGVDADRLAEEKARGITIDLGFAYLPLANGRDRSGSSTCRGTSASSTTCWPERPASMSCSWWSPPTTGRCRRRVEHLADRGPARASGMASWRSPRPTSPMPSAAREVDGRDPRCCCAGTGLAGAEIVPVSVVTGEGLDELRRMAAGDQRGGRRARGATAVSASRWTAASRSPAPARW